LLPKPTSNPLCRPTCAKARAAPAHPAQPPPPPLRTRAYVCWAVPPCQPSSTHARQILPLCLRLDPCVDRPIGLADTQRQADTAGPRFPGRPRSSRAGPALRRGPARPAARSEAGQWGCPRRYCMPFFQRTPQHYNTIFFLRASFALATLSCEHRVFGLLRSTLALGLAF
jgi:hypothetical protein